MKAVIAAVALAFCLAFATPAHAWNCSDPLAERVQVPFGTAGTQGDGDGQLANFNGALYECEVVKPTPPTTTPSTSNSTSSASSAANSSANSASNSSASSNQSQSQKQGQTQTANGGSATSIATGGQGGAGGKATVGNVSSTVSNSGNSTVKNSGNSSNKNTNTATGGNQSQTSTSSANGNGVGNGDNSNNYENVTNVPRDTATAVAPTVLPTVPCFKGMGIGAQMASAGLSFGGGKIDANCADLEASRLAPSLIARCKVYLQNKYVKAAGVTLADCMNVPAPATVIVQAPAQPIPAPVINIPAPVVTIIQAPALPPAPSVAVAAKAVVHRSHPACKCVYTNDGPVKKSGS
jgi:hypothetical protein